MTAFNVDTNNGLVIALVVAFAGPVLGLFGLACWKLSRRIGRFFARVLIIDPVKKGLNEVVDDRIEGPINHVHECFERRTDELSTSLRDHNTKVEAFMEEQRADSLLIHAGGDQIVTYGARERERLWAAIARLADQAGLTDIRPPESITEARSPQEDSTVE